LIEGESCTALHRTETDVGNAAMPVAEATDRETFVNTISAPFLATNRLALACVAA
jgi:hypothetical protein